MMREVFQPSSPMTLPMEEIHCGLVIIADLDIWNNRQYHIYTNKTNYVVLIITTVVCIQ